MDCNQSTEYSHDLHTKGSSFWLTKDFRWYKLAKLKLDLSHCLYGCVMLLRLIKLKLSIAQFLCVNYTQLFLLKSTKPLRIVYFYFISPMWLVLASFYFNWYNSQVTFFPYFETSSEIGKWQSFLYHKSIYNEKTLKEMLPWINRKTFEEITR